MRVSVPVCVSVCVCVRVRVCVRVCFKARHSLGVGKQGPETAASQPGP